MEKKLFWVFVVLFLIICSISGRHLEFIGYWGQSDNIHDYPLNTSNFDLYDQINLAFAHRFFPSPQCTYQGKTIEYVGINLAGNCVTLLDPNCPDLLTCLDVGFDIRYRQLKGQRVLLSIGGASGTYQGPTSQKDASNLATLLWNMFLGGNCTYRPFGNVILDGIDLDIETGVSKYWPDFVIALRSIMSSSSSVPLGGRYYITGSPQCPYPEPYWGSIDDPSTILGNPQSSSSLDLLSVQFYPNQGGCQITASGFLSSYKTWEQWAYTKGNSDAKVLVGVPAALNAAGAGYESTSALYSSLSPIFRNSKFGGVMIWDVEFAKSNPSERFDYNLAKILHQ